MDWDKVFIIIKTFNWLILFLFGSVSFLLLSQPFTTGIILGGLMIIANFNILQYTIRQGFNINDGAQPKKASLIAKYYIRLIIMGVILYFLLTRGWVHPVGLAVGLSIIVLSVLCLAIRLIGKPAYMETT